MKFTVVIPTYNYAKYIKDTLDSVLSQSVQPAEIIVADDGSTDNTANVLVPYRDKIRFIQFPHRGIGATRNAMLGEVRSEWFFNLDADDLLTPGFFEKACSQIEMAVPSVAAAYCDSQTFGLYKQWIRTPEFSISQLKTGNYISMNSFIRTDAARSVGFDASFDDGWEDYNFFLSLVEKGYTGLKLHDVHYLYRIHAASRTSATEDWNTCNRLMERIIQKHTTFFNEAERNAALRKFSPEAAIRLKFSKHIWAHEFGSALKLIGKHPGAFANKFRPFRP